MGSINPYKFHGVFTDGQDMYTKNLVPTHQVYGEELVFEEGSEFRLWNPRRSKACAMLHKGCRKFPVEEDHRILYLGAANGTTASHISDIACEGMVFCVEFSKKAFRDLISVCEKRTNMLPILADATRPEMYNNVVGRVDLIYQDVSQRDQTGIFARNAKEILKDDGYGILMIKARSIDVAARPTDIFEQTVGEMEDQGFDVLEKVPLKPYEKDHAALVVRKITDD